MPTNKMYFNYDNDKKVYVVPVLPEELQVKVAGETSPVTIDRFGEILHKGKRDALNIKFESFFPAKYGKYYCNCTEKEFKPAKKWHKWMLKLMEAEKPCHFVYTNAPSAMNIYADIVSYTAKEKGGDPGTIYYTVELKEHRIPNVRKYSKKKAGKKKSGTGKDGAGTANTAENIGTRNNNTANSAWVRAVCKVILTEAPRGKQAITLPKGTEVLSDKQTDTSSGSGGTKGTASSDSRFLHVQYKDKWYYGQASCFNSGSAGSAGK